MKSILALIILLLTTACSSMFENSKLLPNRSYQSNQSTIKTAISKNKEDVIKQSHTIVNNINKNTYKTLNIAKHEIYDLMVDDTLIIITEISEEINIISYQGVIKVNYHYYKIDNN